MVMISLVTLKSIYKQIYFFNKQNLKYNNVSNIKQEECNYLCVDCDLICQKYRAPTGRMSCNDCRAIYWTDVIDDCGVIYWTYDM